MPSAAVSMKGNCPSAISPLAYLLRFVFSTSFLVILSSLRVGEPLLDQNEDLRVKEKKKSVLKRLL